MVENLLLAISIGLGSAILATALYDTILVMEMGVMICSRLRKEILTMVTSDSYDKQPKQRTIGRHTLL